MSDPSKVYLSRRTVLTCPRQHLRNRNKEDLVESTGVVPAKYPLNVKLENFHNSRMLELEEMMRTLICEGFGIFIVT